MGKKYCWKNSPLKLNTQVIYQHVSLSESSPYKIDIQNGMKGIVYLMEGSLQINQEALKINQAMFIESENTLEIKANKNSEFILFFGLPHNEPICQHGLFVD